MNTTGAHDSSQPAAAVTPASNEFTQQIPYPDVDPIKSSLRPRQKAGPRFRILLFP